MPKRNHDLERVVREHRDRLLRRLRALLELHWSMCGSYAVAEKSDPELRLRILNTRWSILDLVADMLPTPGVPLAIEEDAAEADQSETTVH